MPLITLNPNNAQSNKQVNELSKDMQLAQPVAVQQSDDGIRNYSVPSPVPVPEKNREQMFIEGLQQLQNQQTQIPQQNTLPPLVPSENLKPSETAYPDLEKQVVTEALKMENTALTLESILAQGIARGASDIHLSGGYRANIRVNGVLIELSTPILTSEILLGFAKQITAHRKDIDINEIFDADTSYGYGGARFRVNIFKKSGILSIVLRLIPTEIKSVEQLGLPPIFYDFTKVAGGLILFTGPTGSGKSTTIASLINYINQNMKKHIVTVEDPVEFIYPKAQSIINQREFGIDFDSWPNALKSILRQDPNIVLVGEMRDYETIASAITISETGHLVFATLHTNSAAQSIDRIIDVFPEGQQPQIRTQLANVITAVVSQRLVPLSKGGRGVALEIMIANSAIKNAIREGNVYQIDNMIQTGHDYGMISMEQSLVSMVRTGKITIDVARAVSLKPRELEILLSK